MSGPDRITAALHPQLLRMQGSSVPFDLGTTMNKHDLFDSTQQVRELLTELRTSLEHNGEALSDEEVVNALTELEQEFDELRGSNGLLRAGFDQANALVFAKNLDGRYEMINSQGAALIGKTLSEVLGSDDRELFDHEDAERIMAVDREVMSTGSSRTYNESRGILGVRTTLLTTTSTWFDATHHLLGVLGVAQGLATNNGHANGNGNAPEDESAHDRMRSMATEIVIGEERLRRSLAIELHNGLGQDIALVKLRLSMLRGSVATDQRELLSAIEQIVERVHRSLGTLAFRMSPPSLHDLGLAAALDWLAEDIGVRHGIGVRIEDDGSPAVADVRVRVILFRAVRELLINAATHAGVREVLVRLGREGTNVRIVVQDQGIGFDTSELDRRGYGLFGIREQLKYVEGSMHIESRRGHGTTVTLTAPAGSPSDGSDT